MKDTRKWFLFVLLAMFCLNLVACSEKKTNDTYNNDIDNLTEVELQEFTSGSGLFSINIPKIEGEWTVVDTDDENFLVIDNSDKSFEVAVQGMPKEDLLTDFDGLIEFYHQSKLNEFVKTTEENIDIPDALSAKAESYYVTRNNIVTKLLVVFIEKENGYYIYGINGIEDIYDANIDIQRAAINNLTENI